MSLGLHERRVQRRRRFWLGVVKWLLGLAFFIGLGGYAYYAGSNLAQREVEIQKEKVIALESQLASLTQTNTELDRQLRTAANKVRDWEQAYHRDVPTGEQKSFLDQVSRKLESGLDSDRLSFIIESATMPRDCETDPSSKRFIVRTRFQSGANDSVTFDQRKVTVTASGEPAVNAQGQKEAWFDKDKPLQLIITRLGGETSQAEGLLPLHHAMIAGDAEYRFLVEPGPRGFVVVTGQRCSYP